MMILFRTSRGGAGRQQKKKKSDTCGPDYYNITSHNKRETGQGFAEEEAAFFFSGNHVSSWEMLPPPPPPSSAADVGLLAARWWCVTLLLQLIFRNTWCKTQRKKQVQSAYPTNNALLINFRLSSDAEILLNSHRLSLQTGAKRVKTCTQCA